VERPYTLTYLGSPGDAMSRANAINANGDVAGVFAAGAGTHAFRWHAGQRTDLGVGGANAINSAGDVAGQGWTGSDFRALVWHGTVGDTVPLSGTNAYFAANGVSAGGTELVERHAAACGHDCSFQTYVVQGGTPTPIVASQLEGLALNDAGLVVGQRWDPVTSTTNAFTAQNGTVTMLSPGVVAAAYAVNAAGLVVGYAAVPGGARAATWQNGASTEMPALRRGSLAGAQGVNGSGVVVGSATLCPGSCATRAAVRWKAGHVADLNDLFTSADWTMTYATGINDAGQIVGYGVNRATGASGALLLTPAA
jgi:probable HAF family extracellular repeat protein